LDPPVVEFAQEHYPLVELVEQLMDATVKRVLEAQQLQALFEELVRSQ
jgi:hypothetical protein